MNNHKSIVHDSYSIWNLIYYTELKLLEWFSLSCEIFILKRNYYIYWPSFKSFKLDTSSENTCIIFCWSEEWTNNRRLYPSSQNLHFLIKSDINVEMIYMRIICWSCTSLTEQYKYSYMYSVYKSPNIWNQFSCFMSVFLVSSNISPSFHCLSVKDRNTTELR